MAGISIDFVANVNKFIGGTNDIDGALENVIDSLDDVERAGKNVEDIAKSFDKVEDAADDAAKNVRKDFEKSVKDAGDEAEKLGRKYEDAFDEVRTKGSKANTDFGDSAKKSFRDAGDATETFRDEAKQNLSETVSSFRGDVEDVAQIAQDILGGVVSDLGPVGAAAGAAVAAGIGIGIAALQTQAEEAEVAKQKMLDLADMIREADGDIQALDWGSIVREWGNEYDDVKSWFEPWQKDSVTNFEAMDEAASKFGLSYNSLVQGMAGNTDEGRKAIEELNGAIAEQEKVVEGLTTQGVAYNSAQGQANSAEISRLNSLKGLKSELENATGLTEEAIEYEQKMAEAIEGTAAGIAAKNEALSETIDLNRQVIDGELDYLDTLDSVTAQLAENASEGFDKNTAAGRENLRALGEIAGAALDYSDSITEAGGSQQEANTVIGQGREKLIAAAQQLGMTRDQAEQYANSLGLIPKEVNTKANADTKDAETDLQNVARDRPVKITPWVNQSEWQSAANAAAQNVVAPFVQVRPYVSTRV